MEQLLAALLVVMDILDSILEFIVSGRTKFTLVAKPAFALILVYLGLLGWAMQGCDSVAGLVFQPTNSDGDYCSRCVKGFIVTKCAQMKCTDYNWGGDDEKLV